MDCDLYKEVPTVILQKDLSSLVAIRMLQLQATDGEQHSWFVLESHPCKDIYPLFVQVTLLSFRIRSRK